MSISRSHEPDAMVAKDRLFPIMGKVKPAFCLHTWQSVEKRKLERSEARTAGHDAVPMIPSTWTLRKVPCNPTLISCRLGAALRRNVCRDCPFEFSECVVGRRNESGKE